MTPELRMAEKAKEFYRQWVKDNPSIAWSSGSERDVKLLTAWAVFVAEDLAREIIAMGRKVQ